MNKKTNKNLGRGLSALLDVVDSGSGVQSMRPEGGRDSSNFVAIEKLSPGKLQPRQSFRDADIAELANSIEQHGVLQPILVRRLSGKEGSFEIIAGERRWRAAQSAKLHRVPVLVREMSDAEALEVGLVENLQREGLEPLEEAAGYRRLINEFDHTQEQVAKALGKSRPYISNMVRLLGLPNPVKDMLRSSQITTGHARALLNCENPVDLARVVIKKGLSVRQTEQLVKTTSNTSQSRQESSPKDANILSLEKDLTAILGMRVRIDFNGIGGTLKITYGNLDQLDSVLLKLSQGKYGRN